MENEAEWVVVGNYPKLISAELAKSKLRLGGIEAEIFDGIHANMMWLHTNAIGGIKLKVRRMDSERAKEVLGADQEVDEDVVAPEDEIREGDPFCPACHSKRIGIETIPRPRSGSAIRDWFVKTFADAAIMRCLDCGKEWRK